MRLLLKPTQQGKKMPEESNVEINLENVEEIAEGVIGYLESIQDKYTELEMIFAITTIYNSVISALEDRGDSVEQIND